MADAPEYPMVVRGIPDLPLDDDPENFRPIKDLFRRITMSRGTGKLGKVVVQQDWQGRYFVTSVFGEENAKKVYDCLAGNIWYGCRLDVVWLCTTKTGHKLPQRILLRKRDVSSFSEAMIIENAYPTRDLQYVRPLSRRVPSRPTRNFSLPTNSLPPPALPSPGLGLVPSDTPFEFLYDQSGSLIGSRPALSPNTLGQYVQVVGQSLHQWDLADPPTFPQQLVLPKDCRLVQTQPFPIDSGPMITPAPRESHQIASIQRSEIAVHPIIANGSEESSSDRRRSSRTPSSSRDGGRIEEIAKASVAPSHIEEVVPGSSSRSTHHHPSSHRDRGLSRSRASVPRRSNSDRGEEASSKSRYSHSSSSRRDTREDPSSSRSRHSHSRPHSSSLGRDSGGGKGKERAATPVRRLESLREDMADMSTQSKPIYDW